MRLKIEKCNRLCQPDPFIIEDNGLFFIFVTGIDGVHCYYSEELCGTYKYHGIVFSSDKHKEYWAPAVIKIKDEYFLYVSYMLKESNDVHEQKLIVSSSKNILGPYTFIKDLALPFSIDAHPVINDSGMYMFYSINDYDSTLAGTRIVVDRMISPTQLDGHPKVVVEPSIEQEIYMKNRFREGQDWYTIEGACYFYNQGIHYLLYSANCFENEYYFVGYSISKSKLLDLTKIEFTKYPSKSEYTPLLSKNDFESGTGHNSVINYNGEWYIIYHGRDINEENVPYDNRSMRIGKLIIDGEKLSVDR